MASFLGSLASDNGDRAVVGVSSNAADVDKAIAGRLSRDEAAETTMKTSI